MMRVLAPLVLCIPFAACEAKYTADPGSTEAGLEAEGNDCMAVYDDCRAQGGDELSCKDRYNECEGLTHPDGPPPPPDGDRPEGDGPRWEECKDAFVACDEAGETLDVCLDKVRFCLGAVCHEPPPPPPGDGGPGPCEDELHKCLETTGDEVACKERYAACHGWGPPPPPPDADGQGNACEDVYTKCLETTGDEVGCKERYNACQGWGPPPPPPGEGEGPPDEGHDGEGPPGEGHDCPDHDRPSPCQIGFDACAKSAADEAEQMACKAAFEACLAAAPGPR